MQKQGIIRIQWIDWMILILFKTVDQWANRVFNLVSVNRWRFTLI